MKSFSAKIYKIGINPYVLLPIQVLKQIFEQSGKDKGPIPVKGKIDGHAFTQTLVKYSGKWRLYLNTPMRTAAKKETGDTVTITVMYDAAERKTPDHAGFMVALKKNKEAMEVYKSLAPYLQKEMNRYLHQLKTEASVQRNIEKAIQFLLGKERFVGRDGIGGKG